MFNKEIIIPYDKLNKLKIQVGDYTIPVLEFIKILIKQEMEG